MQIKQKVDNINTNIKGKVKTECSLSRGKIKPSNTFLKQVIEITTKIICISKIFKNNF